MPSRLHRFLPRVAGALLLGLAALIGPPREAVAQAAAPGTTPDGWRFQITPYLWMSGVAGDLTISPRAPTLQFSESFGDVLSDLDAGIFITGLAIRDRFVISADVSYVATSRKGELLAAPPVSAKGSLDQFSTTLLAGYRAVEQPGFSLDLLGGLRAWSIEAEAEARVAGTPFARQTATLDWVDPILAVRLRGDISPRLSAHVIGDIGGFGAGARFTWQLAGLVNYQLSENLYASGGYRHLATDYREGGRRLDFSLSGPILGLTYRF
ncbi:hypothetical protein [Falsiroseomonas sp.]|uniref:hypothetical protein n=1 Tax=Falsiroseomonas sp. TaxID=2870721 RepID=UPI0027348870|nr:hypothetical protein [Falsiroseomonas sp.]MDP3419155.1 hypothetical protein [Falsiroseomonas sp.]